MLDAIVRAYPNVTRASVRDALAQTKDFPGVTGNTTFDENGDAQKKLVKAIIKDGQFVPVEGQN
jgi:branched-chain amino acid transport system substrate-binding protein